MVSIALGFLCGVLWIQTRPELGMAAMGAPLAVLFVLICTHWRPRWLVAVVAGVVWAAWRADVALDEVWFAAGAGESVVVGTVISIPERDSERVQFDLEIEGWREQGLPQKVRLSWYAESPPPWPSPGVAKGWDKKEVRAGERWQLLVRLKSPRGFANPGGYDYEGQLFREGIGATGYVRTDAGNRRVEGAGWRRPVLQVREAIVRRIEAALPESSARGVITGLAVGASQGISAEQWRVFAATGITHLIAISGTHVTMIALLAMWLVGLLWNRQRTPNPSSCRGDSVASWGAVVAAVYAVLAGFSVPTQRTLVMFLVALGAMRLRRAQPPSQILALALIAVLLLDPHAPLAPGFWLSFVAVAAIFWSIGRSGRHGMHTHRPVRDFLRVQGAITLALFPATLALFGTVSLVAPVVNLLAIPFFSFILVPGILLGVCVLSVVPQMGAALLTLMAKAFDLFWIFLHWASALPAALVYMPEPSVELIACLTVTAAILIVPFPWRLRALGLFLLLPLLFPASRAPPSGGIQLTVLDVGQGLSVFVRTRSHALLYDTGPGFRSGRSAGDLAVLPFLRNAGISRLDMLVVSHSDNDHAGGVKAVEQGMEIAAVRRGGVKEGACARGERWSWDGVDFEFLHPEAAQDWSDNDGSCVLSIRTPGGSILLPGDLESPAELYLLTRQRLPAAELILVPHHGSRTSSTPGLVTAANARYAIVSAGYRNRWGFPHPEVADRWCFSGAQVLNTAYTGAMSFTFNPHIGLGPPDLYRMDHRRYWQASADVSPCAENAVQPVMIRPSP